MSRSYIPPPLSYTWRVRDGFLYLRLAVHSDCIFSRQDTDHKDEYRLSYCIDFTEVKQASAIVSFKYRPAWFQQLARSGM
jgi:hypothetical protein